MLFISLLSSPWNSFRVLSRIVVDLCRIVLVACESGCACGGCFLLPGYDKLLYTVPGYCVSGSKKYVAANFNLFQEIEEV